MSVDNIPQSAEVPPGVQGTGRAAGARSRILVVDDEDSILEVLTDVLESEGHQVVTAANGREGLEQLARARPDLVLLDWMMPHVDGRQMLARMRAHPEWASVPVLVMSAGRLSPGERAHIPYFLAKPFELEVLLALIDQLLRQQGAVPPTVD